jgi:AcrR family transcriptional regulator
MEEGQRTRILEGMAEAMAQRDAGDAVVSVADVIARSGVSSAAFYEAFPDREACLLATFDLGVQRASDRMLAAYDVERRWLDAIKAALAAGLRFLDEDPALGGVLIVHSISSGEQVMRRRVGVLDALAQVVDRGRLQGPAGRRPPPPIIAEGVVGAVLAIIQNRLLADGEGQVIDLFGSLVSVIVLPYLGAGIARRELTRPPPRVRADVATEPSGPGEPIRRGAMRLTYRTARVMGAVADYPGASNREVADRAGIVDQGQISKLLARLESRRLIAKIGEGRARGAPNAWRLTEDGVQLLRSVSARDWSAAGAP